MSTLIPQQLVGLRKPGVEQIFALSTAAFESIEKLVALNLQVVKATLAENQAIAMKALSAKPEELFELSTGLAKPTAEKMASYSRHVYGIMSEMQGELFSTVQSRIQQHQLDVQGFVENLTKNVPPASNTAATA
jgi:phasin family protein